MDPAQIGKYIVKGTLGRGGYGVVYLAFDPEINRWVAIKMLLDLSNWDYFDAEAFTTGKLSHVNIVKVYDKSRDEFGKPFLVMEYLEGRTLSHFIATSSSAPLMDKLYLMTQVAEGLSFAHAKGVVHRDIKPANIMVLADLSAKILDFGIALFPGRNPHGEQGMVIGSTAYLAPELLAGARADARSDIFAFGVMLYELITGSHPFWKQTDSESDLITAIAGLEPPSVQQLAPDCPDVLSSLIRRALSKAPQLRWRAVDEFKGTMQAILFGLKREKANAILPHARRLFAAGAIDRASICVAEAEHLDADNPYVTQLRAEIERSKDLRAARQYAATLVQESQVLNERQCYVEAARLLEKAVKLDDDNEAAKTTLNETRRYLESDRLVSEGHCWEKQGRLPQARECYRKALDANNARADVPLLIRGLEEKLEFERRQLRAAAISLTRDALNAGDVTKVGELIARMHEFGPACPGDSDAIAQLSGELRRLEAYEAALKEAETLYASRQFEDAEDVLVAAISEGPPDLRATLLFGQIQEAVWDFGRGIKIPTFSPRWR